MRLNPKYKIYSQAGIIPVKFHQRLLKFKRPKWKKVQKLAIKSSKLSSFLINSSLIKNNFKFWDRIKSYYKEGIKIKNSLYCLFDRSFSYKYLTSILKNSKNSSLKVKLLDTLIKPTYRLDILLWKLHIYKSSFQAREAINNNIIKVNSKNVKGNLILKKGDIVTFSKSFNNINFVTDDVSLLFPLKGVLPTFIEIDYYTGTLIIVKDIYDLNLNDIYLLIPSSYNIKKLKDFLCS